jgi:hypothetical protein
MHERFGHTQLLALLQSRKCTFAEALNDILHCGEPGFWQTGSVGSKPDRLLNSQATKIPDKQKRPFCVLVGYNA